jgi:Na+/melibiose symporter-like transporter
LGANALFEAGLFVAVICGTVGSGWIMATRSGNIPWVFIPLAALLILSVFSSKMVPRASHSSPEKKIEKSFLKVNQLVLKTVSEPRSVFLSVVGIAWFWFFAAIVVSLLPSYVKDVWGGKEALVTFFSVLFSVGVAIGSILCNQLSGHRVELGLVPLGSIGITLFSFDLYWTSSHAPAIQLAITSLVDFVSLPGAKRIIFDVFMMAVTSGIYVVPLYTLLQRDSAPQLRARAMAANNLFGSTMMVVSALFLVTLLAVKVSIPAIFGFFEAIPSKGVSKWRSEA